MDLESYLRSLNVNESDIQRFRDEKIDCNVISLMTDEELAWFLKSAGDRVLVRNFVKSLTVDGQRKQHLINTVRTRLAAMRSKRKRVEKSSERKRKNGSTATEGPNTKSTRQLYLGWKHREGCRVIQVIEKKGGGTKLLSMPKDYKKIGIIELGKKLYFPNGKSHKGSENHFSFDLVDSSNKPISSDKTVLEILDESSPKIPRVYLKTEKLEESMRDIEPFPHVIRNSAPDENARQSFHSNTNDVEKFTHEIGDSAPADNSKEITSGEQTATTLYADISVSKYTEATLISFKDKKQIFEHICNVQGPPNVDFEDFNPVNFNYPVARIEENGVTTLNIESEFLEQLERSNLLVNLPIVANSSTENSPLSETLLPIVARNDIVFSEIILGVGSQGTVRQGTWLGTEVAIKSFKTGRLTEMEIREVKLLARIRHPNIIQIMGISLEKRQTHLIFELVKGRNLGDILFDEEIKHKYNLNIKKKTKLLLQVCQAVSYLHGQTNPIIHQDIKPDNILVTKNMDVKLCDLGLAKLKNMATQFRTIVGSIKGTVIYMPPEILLSKGTATIYSDIWSLGCTIFETYSEDDVWPDLGEDFTSVLKMKMENLEVPNISILPPLFQPIVQKCLNYHPTQRPGIEELMNYFSAKAIESDT